MNGHYLMRLIVGAAVLAGLLVAAVLMERRVPRNRPERLHYYAAGVIAGPQAVDDFKLQGWDAEPETTGLRLLTSLVRGMTHRPRKALSAFGHAEPDRSSRSTEILVENDCVAVQDVVLVWRRAGASPTTAPESVAVTRLNLSRAASAGDFARRLEVVANSSHGSPCSDASGWRCSPIEIWLQGRRQKC